ncbi:hypothetical protein ATANTOWER_005146 [Ataeniobius toweri]|uniref:Uncharacterized protein n=1 Tax=Ataeniobius toweri TaxID=208326 RepID=A0ABU7BAS5_9TELE|nr:hypothetical protein [Ataeniobius toweri]
MVAHLWRVRSLRRVFTSLSITGQPYEKLDKARNLAGIRPGDLLYQSKACLCCVIQVEKVTFLEFITDT